MAGRLLTLFFFAASIVAQPAVAQVVRCAVTERTDDRLPEWIEYEISAEADLVEIRDSTGIANNVDWVRGRLLENSNGRLVIAWDVGAVAAADNDPGSRFRVLMRLSRLPNGKNLVVGVLGTLYPDTYHGTATCGA
jgi:ribosomal protein S28E/S33